MMEQLTIFDVMDETKNKLYEVLGVTIPFRENCTFRHILDTNQSIPCTLRNRLFILLLFYKVFISRCSIT
jgi:hypothetical protein